MRFIHIATGHRRKRPGALRLPFLALLGTLALGGCDSDGVAPGDTPRIQVLLTDAPSDMMESAEIWISRVYLQGGEGEADDPDLDDDGIDDGEDDDVPGRLDLLTEPLAEPVDLLRLRDGIVAEVTEPVEIPEGDYAQLRVVIDSARVTLAAGFAFEDGEESDVLFVPSGQQSGIKVQLTEGVIDVDVGEVITVVVDVDVDRNFVVQENQDGTVRRILFTPLLQEIDRDEVEG